MPPSCATPPRTASATASLVIPRAVSLAVAMASSTSPPLPRLAIAATVSLTAVALEILRRRRRGPIRHTPPLADEQPHVVRFGKGQCKSDGLNEDDFMHPVVEQLDPFFWLRDDDRKSEKVLNHLREENAYTNYQTLHLRRFANRLYKELLSHYVESDTTVPAPRGIFAYYTKTVAGKSYKYYCRKPKFPDGSLGEEEVLLDVNQLAQGLKHCEVGHCEVSPDDLLMAYSVDTSGYETYEIRFLELSTGRALPNHTIPACSGSFEWGRDSQLIFYSTLDEAHRPYKFWRRNLRLPKEQSPFNPRDLLLYTESDPQFYMYAVKSRSGRFLFIASEASMTSEFRYIDVSGDPLKLSVHVFRERVPGVMYSVTHAMGDEFYITTNLDGATNFKAMKTTIDNPAEWSPFLPYEDQRKIDYITCFERFAVVGGRQNGYSQMWILPQHDVSKMYLLPTQHDAHVLAPTGNLEYGSGVFRYTYEALTTPKCVYDFNPLTRESVLLKQTNVPSYDASCYTTERIEAVSKDGTTVPMSLVYKKLGGRRSRGNPARKILLYGYGSYESPMDPNFSMTRLPLLDRGVVYAIAHVRGGGEFGRNWYESARLENKVNTFDDFIACAQHLVDSGRTKKEWLGIEGRSAGGLLVGAVLNMRPDLFRAAIAGVPFVDVLNTMSDASIPLTTGEWQEWGNPHIRKYFDAIRDYCPYSNVGPHDYPALLVEAGLFDPRVMYSEPAKWVAKLRKVSTGKKQILLKVDLSSGHFSASNRYHYLKEKAFQMAWLLYQLEARRLV